MNYPFAPQPYPQVSPQDEQSLDLLGVLYYVYGGLVGLAALGLCGAALVPAVLVSAAARGGGGPPAALVGGILLMVFGVVGVLLVGKAILMILAGRALRGRRGYFLAMIGACLALINVPLGTALGIFTFVVLQRPGVKARFGG